MLRLGRITKHLGPRGEGGPTSSGWGKGCWLATPSSIDKRENLLTEERLVGEGSAGAGGKTAAGCAGTPPPGRVVASGINSVYACSELFDPQLIANRIETDTIMVRPFFNQQPIVCCAAV